MTILSKSMTGVYRQPLAMLDTALYAKSIGSNHSAGDRCAACNQPRGTLYAYDLPVEAKKPTFRPTEEARVCLSCMGRLNREKAREAALRAKRARKGKG